MCLDVNVQQLTGGDAAVTSDQVYTDQKYDDMSPSSVAQSQHCVGSCQLPPRDNRPTTDNSMTIDNSVTIDNRPTIDNSTTIDGAVTTDLPIHSSTSLMSPSSLVAFPGQLRLVPVVYVNQDGLPTCYEVVQPVPSPSCFHPSSAHADGSYDCVYFQSKNQLHLLGRQLLY